VSARLTFAYLPDGRVAFVLELPEGTDHREVEDVRRQSLAGWDYGPVVVVSDFGGLDVRVTQTDLGPSVEATLENTADEPEQVPKRVEPWDARCPVCGSRAAILLPGQRRWECVLGDTGPLLAGTD
jgi:hypothetical protein